MQWVTRAKDKMFQSAPSVKRATSLHAKAGDGPAVSIRALREEGDTKDVAKSLHVDVSIRALREEGDHPASPSAPHPQCFNPRPP